MDTDVFSVIWQGRPEAGPFETALRGKYPVLSFTTVAEAHYGATYANWGETRVRKLEAALRPYIIAPYSPDMAKLWGKLKTQARKAGHCLGQAEHTNDLWVAATAIFYDAPLATLNRRHFEDLPGLTLISTE